MDWLAPVPPTVSLTSDNLGNARARIVYGWVSAGHQISAATAAVGAGALRTEFGIYLAAFTLAGALCVIAAMMAFRINRSPSSGGDS